MASRDPLKDHELKIRLIREASESLKDYMALLDKTRELEANINHETRQREILYRKLNSDKADLMAHERGIATLGPIQLKDTEDRVLARQKELDVLDEILEVSTNQLAIHKAATNEVKTMAVAFKDVGRQVGALGKKLIAQGGYLLEQQKAVKGTELSMGILSNQANGFRKNIYKTSLTTTQIGIGTKELATIQGTYSDNIGRSVQLSEEQLTSMAELAKGTVLGAEGAAEFAGQMENFNVSAKGSAELVDDMLKTSHKMGVSSSKVIKNVQKNMKLLQKYSFKGGVKGLTKMAALATKFKFEMQSIADFAENLITPEGAVEAAAKLQVLGGAWARLGDPFELMYRSRNDLAGLTNDIINATKETARFDKATGEVTIDPMELHRLREVANATGLEFDSLAKSAKEAAKFAQIESNMSTIFNKEDKEFLSSLATWNKDKGEFEVVMQTKDGTVKESVNALRKITPQMVKTQKEYQQTLKQNAEQSMTFVERWEGLENMFRSILLPGFEAFANALEHSIGDFHKWAIESGFVDKLVGWGKIAGELAGALVKWVAENPLMAGMTALLGSAALWIARGVQLGIGFNTVAGVGGGTGTGTGGTAGKLFGGMTKGGGIKGFGGNITKGLGSLGAVGGGLLSAGIGGYNEWTENEAAGMNTNDNINRTGTRAVAAGGGAWGGAALGASIGTLVFPGVGTAIGGILGGVIGGMAGDKLGDEAGDMIWGNKTNKTNKLNDFIARDGESPVPFSKDDTVIGAKKGGPIDEILNRSMPSDNSNSFDAITSPSMEGVEGLFSKLIDKLSNNDISIDNDVTFNTKPITSIINKEVEDSKQNTRGESKIVDNDNIFDIKPIISSINKGVESSKELINNLLNQTVPSDNDVSFDTKPIISSINKGIIEKDEPTFNRSEPGNNDSTFNTKSILSSNLGKGITGKAIEDAKPTSVTTDKVSVKFDKPLRIEGRIELTSNGEIAELDLNDPILMRELSKTIQEELGKAIGGGKISSNPSVVS